MVRAEMSGGEGDDLLDAGSLAGLVRTATLDKERVPVLFDEERGWISSGELEEESRLLTGSFAAAGLERNDRVILSAKSSAALVTAHLACLRSGLVAVPTNPSYTDRERAHIVTDAKPRAVVSDDGHVGALVVEHAGRDTASFLIENGRLQKTTTSAEWAGLDEVGGCDPALLVYTSGTTGRPKGALLSQANLLASLLAISRAWRWTPEERLVLPLPLFHVHGLCVGVMGALLSGSSVVLRPGFEREDLCSAARRHHATMLFGVPTIYARLRDETRLSKLRLCVSGSAPLPPELCEEFRRATGQQILERYGMSETLMIASNPYDGERRPGTVGQPLAGVELALDHVRDSVGEILVRGPNVFTGYLGLEKETAGSFLDGWFRTGDLASIDDGYLTIRGRLSELIITGGYNVYPREVEEVLRELPGVAEAAVVGWPDPEWGERVVAFIEAAGEAAPSTAEITSHCSGRLAPYKVPRVVVEVAALPRNALGKVKKGELTEHAV